MPKTIENEMEYRAIGQFGVEVATDADHVHIRLPRSAANARLSQSGKMRITASTGGWLTLPDSDVRLNLNSGVKA